MDSGDSSSGTSAEEAPPGPVDCARCSVTGSGFSGGAAQAPAQLTIISKDASGRRLLHGGCDVFVRVSAAGGNAPEGSTIEVKATDNSDGTYSANYVVPSRGNYNLSIAINGTPIGGSPFPVFFSPPETGAAAASAGLAADQDLGQTEGGLAAGAPQLVGNNVMAAEATQALGGAIVNSLYVSNINAGVTLEQLKQLFSYCGKIQDMRYVGPNKDIVTVEYTTALEARGAMGLNGVVVGNQPLQVQLAAESSGNPTSGGGPYMAMQVQQMQHIQVANMQATQLAVQLASLRAIAKTTLLPAIKEEERQEHTGKAAALAAAAELTKKLGSTKFEFPVSKGSQRRHSLSRSPPSRRRRSPSQSRSKSGRHGQRRRRSASIDRRSYSPSDRGGRESRRHADDGRRRRWESEVSKSRRSPAHGRERVFYSRRGVDRYEDRRRRSPDRSRGQHDRYREKDRRREYDVGRRRERDSRSRDGDYKRRDGHRDRKHDLYDDRKLSREADHRHRDRGDDRTRGNEARQRDRGYSRERGRERKRPRRKDGLENDERDRKEACDDHGEKMDAEDYQERPQESEQEGSVDEGTTKGAGDECRVDPSMQKKDCLDNGGNAETHVAPGDSGSMDVDGCEPCLGAGQLTQEGATTQEGIVGVAREQCTGDGYVAEGSQEKLPCDKDTKGATDLDMNCQRTEDAQNEDEKMEVDNMPVERNGVDDRQPKEGNERDGSGSDRAKTPDNGDPVTSHRHKGRSYRKHHKKHHKKHRREHKGRHHKSSRSPEDRDVQVETAKGPDE